MSYADEAALRKDTQFQERLLSALYGEAKGKTDLVANTVLRANITALALFLPFITTAPGFGTTYATGGQAAIDDGMILSALQANWATVVALNTPETPA